MPRRDEVRRQVGRGRLETIFAGDSGGPLDAERERRTIEGACDDTKAALVSKTNGESHRISWPKNKGTCELTLVSKDEQGRDIDNTAVVMRSNSWIESYTAPRGTWSIVFRCPTSTGTCLLELDA